MSLIDTFASNVKKYRSLAGISQEQLADSSGLHRTYISLVERSKRNISIENIERISKALNVEAYKLLMEESQNDKTNP